jgi:beta-lactamase regulating signal transducer with metallopeptidase domain
VIYSLRGIAVSFSVFFALYTVLSVTVCCVWRRVLGFSRQCSSGRAADLLFALRIAPFVVSAGVTLVFAVPSFLLLEPRAIDEQMSGLSIGLGVSGIAVVLVGIWRATAALVKSWRAIARWSNQARVIESDPIRSLSAMPVLRISASAPPLTVAGILRPSVWLSRAAAFALTKQELETALRHEMVHVRRWDNLRKLALQFVAFPGMTELEIAWHEATEMMADDAAVSSACEALDLAQAMIKLSRISLRPSSALMTALVHNQTERLVARVLRLITWDEHRKNAVQAHWLGYAACAGTVVVAMLSLVYGHLLVNIHQATEFLAR